MIEPYTEYCHIRNGSCDFFARVRDYSNDSGLGDSFIAIDTGESIPVGATVAIPDARAISHARISSEYTNDDSAYTYQYLTRNTYDLDPAHYYFNDDAAVLIAYGNASSYDPYGSGGDSGLFVPDDFTSEQVEYARNFLIVNGIRFQYGTDLYEGVDDLDFRSTSSRPPYNPTITYSQTRQTVSGNSQSGTVFAGGNISISWRIGRQ